MFCNRSLISGLALTVIEGLLFSANAPASVVTEIVANYGMPTSGYSYPNVLNGYACVNIDNGSTTAGLGVDIWTCGLPHESFAFNQLSSGAYTISPQNGGNLCLTQNGIGTEVTQNTCSSGATNQGWNVVSNQDGTCTIETLDGTGAFELAAPQATADSTPVILSNNAGDPQASFIIPGLSTAGPIRVIGPTYTPDPNTQSTPQGREFSGMFLRSTGDPYFPGGYNIPGNYPTNFSRDIEAYIPRQYNGGAAAYMVIQDAGWNNQLQFEATLDNGISNGTLPVMILVFVDSGPNINNGTPANPYEGTERNYEYDTLGTRYAEWMQNVVLPFVESQLLPWVPGIAFSTDPQACGAIGYSSGGLASFNLAWFSPTLCTRVISFSGSFTNLEYPASQTYPNGGHSYSDFIIQQQSQLLPIRAWLEVGTNDLDASSYGTDLRWQDANQAVVRALTSQQYPIHFDLALQAVHGDTNVLNQTLYEAMTWVWQGYQPNVAIWTRLGGSYTGAVAIGTNMDGRLEAFARAPNDTLWHNWQTTPNGVWSGWAGLEGMTITGDPVVASNADGRLEVFAVGADTALWHIWQTAPGQNWSGWYSLGFSLTSGLSAVTNTDGRVEVFGLGTDSALWHVWQVSPGGDWSLFYSLGGFLTSGPATALNSDGRMEAFARGADNALWHISQTSAGGNWGSWSSLGQYVSDTPVIVAGQDGRLNAVIRGSDNSIYVNAEAAPADSVDWTGWGRLGGYLTTYPAAIVTADGQLEVFGAGGDNALWGNAQTSAGPGTWTGWTSLGGALASGPTAALNPDGPVNVFIRGTDTSLWYIAQ
jgi:hypothetical protein